jgi:L-arabinonolactonase
MPDIAVACDAANRLGEGPMWNQAERALYWIDALGPALHRLDASGRHARWPLHEAIGSFVFRRQGGLVGAFKSGFSTIDLASGACAAMIDPEPDRPTNALNDGKCDRRGRYWCGSRAGDLVSPVGALFRLDPDWRCRKMDDGFAVSNGIAWSPDDSTMYFSDSPSGSIFAYEFDLDDGEICNRRLFASTTALGGLPDGATVDAEGCYWSALFGGGAVARFDPKGRLVTTVRLPVKNPTMCTFGSDRLDVLYVTSARALMSNAELASQPLAGALFAITGLEVGGLAETPFAG